MSCRNMQCVGSSFFWTITSHTCAAATKIALQPSVQLSMLPAWLCISHALCSGRHRHLSGVILGPMRSVGLMVGLDAGRVSKQMDGLRIIPAYDPEGMCLLPRLPAKLYSIWPNRFLVAFYRQNVAGLYGGNTVDCDVMRTLTTVLYLSNDFLYGL